MKFQIKDFDKQISKIEIFFQEFGYFHLKNIFSKKGIEDLENGMLNLCAVNQDVRSNVMLEPIF